MAFRAAWTRSSAQCDGCGNKRFPTPRPIETEEWDRPPRKGRKKAQMPCTGRAARQSPGTTTVRGEDRSPTYADPAKINRRGPDAPEQPNGKGHRQHIGNHHDQQLNHHVGRRLSRLRAKMHRGKQERTEKDRSGGAGSCAAAMASSAAIALPPLPTNPATTSGKETPRQSAPQRPQRQNKGRG